ncbi:MAG: 3-deoxy-D-manno-octulosonic acid transferase [Rubripirellula sp.]
MLANFLYAVALTILSPIIAYRMIRHGRYRRGIRQKLLGLSATEANRISGGERCLWIHAVSVGEVNLLPGVVKRLEPQVSCPIVISTSTDTGYDLAVQHFGRDRVFFCPLDFSWAVRRTLRHLAPVQLVLAELELWPNLVRQASESECRVVIINGRLSDRSAAGYQRFAKWTQPIFRAITWIGCQDETSKSHFADCGTDSQRLAMTGSLKFDDAPTERETVEVKARVQWARVAPSHRVWIVGSTQEGEERMALEVYQTLQAEHPDLRLILVPRHTERFHDVASLIHQQGFAAKRRSQEQQRSDATWDAGTVILVDTIGELRHWWGVGQLATVGGSFGDRGGQNMLEPAGYGAAVSFGPNTRNFKEISARLLAASGAVRVSDSVELEAFVRRCLVDADYAASLGNAARTVVLSHRGATQRTVDALVAQLKTTANVVDRDRLKAA